MVLSVEEMEQKLRSVNKSYDFFVEVTLYFIENYGIGDELMDYIDKHPKATASDVVNERLRLSFGSEL